jgi:hypothetical protein
VRGRGVGQRWGWRALGARRHALAARPSRPPRSRPLPPAEYVIDWKLPSLATPARDSWPPLDVAVGDTVVFQWKGGLAYALYRIAKRE